MVARVSLECSRWLLGHFVARALLGCSRSCSIIILFNFNITLKTPIERYITTARVWSGKVHEPGLWTPEVQRCYMPACCPKGYPWWQLSLHLIVNHDLTEFRYIQWISILHNQSMIYIMYTLIVIMRGFASLYHFE